MIIFISPWCLVKQAWVDTMRVIKSRAYMRVCSAIRQEGEFA